MNCSHRRLTEVPLDLPANTTTLLLNNNDIGTLQQNAFCSLTELRHLDLSVNKLKSDKIAPDTFNALGLLLYLDISYNSLCMSNACFPQRLYRPLYSLKVFMVTGNTARDQRGPKEYPFRSLSVLQTLTELHISGIDHVDIPSDISLFKNLEVLDLYGGYMEIITAATFLALRDTNVTTLSLRSNNIGKVQNGSFSNLPVLRNLNLACNYRIGFNALIGVLWATENSGIDSLVMDYVEHFMPNEINFKLVCDTPFAKRLRRLSIRRNNIMAIDGKYFGKCLPVLQWMNIGFNSVVYFERHELKRSEVIKIFPPKLLVMDVSNYNMVLEEYRTRYCLAKNLPFDDEFRRPLVLNETAERTGNVSFKRSNNPMYMLPLLRYVYGEYVSIGMAYDIPSVTFYPESSILYINVSNTKAFKSLTKPIMGLTQMHTLDMSHGALTVISADCFRHFESLRFLNLSDNKLGKTNVDRNKTQDSSAFNPLSSLVELDLSRNFFKSVEKGTFANLSCLRTLKLNDNMFTRHLSLDLSRLRSLHLLDLSFNQMTSLSQDFRRVLDVLSERVHFNLDISGNPLVCHSCDSLNFLRWLRTTKVRVVARDDLRCADNPHSRVLRLSLDDVEALCAASGVSLLVVFTVTGGVGGCLLMLLLFLYVQRWRMRWYYYSLKRRWRQHGQSTDDVSDYKYGAVVVNADADLDWVAHDLVENVETDWALSLYISERDSPCGPIAENIVVSLETSRRVLFVLTPDFFDDNWCNFALNMALQRDQTSLVLLYVKPVQLESTSSTLRALMSPRSECTLIEWGDGEHAQSLFWQRLHDTLLPTPETDMLLCDLAPCMQRPSAD